MCPNNSGVIATPIQFTGTAPYAYKTAGGNWGTLASDVRVKRDVEDYTKGLAECLSLRPRYFNYNGAADTTDDGTRFVGLVADEVQQSEFPEMVRSRRTRMDKEDEHSETDLLMLDTSDLSFAVLNALRELNERLKKLENPDG